MRIRLAKAAAAAAISFTALFQPCGAYAAEAGADKCRGTNMLAETQAKDPETYSRIMAQAAATENAGALLWKIERDGRPPSYLFGTVHLTDERVTKLSPAVEQALGQTKTIALEVSDVSDKATAAVIAQSAPLVMFTDGRRLDGLLSGTEYDTVKRIVSRSGMPSDLAALFKPWIVTMILSVSDCERASVQQGARVLDMKLAEIGKTRGMQVVGLETIPEQLQALAAVPEPQQLAMLRASLKFADRTNDLMETLVQLYLDRKISAACLSKLRWQSRLASATTPSPASRRSCSPSATSRCAPRPSPYSSRAACSSPSGRCICRASRALSRSCARLATP